MHPKILIAWIYWHLKQFLSISPPEYFLKYHHAPQMKKRSRISAPAWLNGKSTRVWSFAPPLARTGTTSASRTERGRECCVESLQWRHNGRDSVSNHQPRECLLSRLIRRRSKKTSKPRVTDLCAGNSPVTGEFPAQRASNAENVFIWWSHHVNCRFVVKCCIFDWTFFGMLTCLSYVTSNIYLFLRIFVVVPGDSVKNANELLNLRAGNFSTGNKIHIFQCMGQIY